MHLLCQIGLVSIGSALGGLARWGASVAFARWVGIAFPWGTLAINVSGSFFLGWFLTFVTERMPPHAGGWLSGENLRLLIAVGFTGAFTTFSTYEYEAAKLLDRGAAWSALIYLAGSVVLGLLAVRGGEMAARGW